MNNKPGFLDATCPSCGKGGMQPFYEVDNVPVHSCVLFEEQEEAIKFPRGKIILAFCGACGFITNIVFNPSKLDYSRLYEDQQCFSPTFSKFAQDLANRLIERYDLYGKSILEIGCGKGDFLAMLCRIGHNRGVGIDPAYTKERIDKEVSRQVTFIKDYYSERYVKHHGDVVVCRHTLEHIHQTSNFLSIIRHSIGNHLDTIVFFEVPDTTRILLKSAFWDIYYEHCSYFTPGSLARLFRSLGFEVNSLYRGFGDQYLLIEARPVVKISKKLHELEETPMDTAKNIEVFNKGCNEKLAHWKSMLQQIVANKKRAAIWGSGSKCVAFMSTLNIKDEIEYVVDINPYRHGKFIPSIGKKIVSPNFLKEDPPDVTIVMNSIYKQEIQQTLDEMGIATEVIGVE